MDLFKETYLHIEILTCHSDGGKFKSYVQLNTPGVKPVIVFNPTPTRKTREESLEVLVVSLRETVEAKGMEARKMKLAREMFDEEFEADAKGVAQSSSHS